MLDSDQSSCEPKNKKKNVDQEKQLFGRRYNHKYELSRIDNDYNWQLNLHIFGGIVLLFFIIITAVSCELNKQAAEFRCGEEIKSGSYCVQC